MVLEPGQNLLHYRLVAKLGEGGMGVVFKAHDQTLDREVAIKLLPHPFVSEPDRLARFEREARSLAALNHPNIAAVYGLHETDGTRFLAMEYVAGENLEVRLQRGALPLDEALDLARQMAEGLEAAHESGLIHRDLKPANLMVTLGGRLKILDFGLAKALASREGDSPDPGLSQSPTLTVAGTQAGIILGTAAYMSPEQARGQAVDRRTDIWAFGAVLFEMLSGGKAFDGDTVTDVLASVVKQEPAWARLPGDTPASIQNLLSRCLAKPLRQRLRDIGDAQWDLHPDSVENETPVPPPRFQGWAAWMLPVVLVLGLGAGYWLAGRRGGSAPEAAGPPMRTEIVLPDDAPLAAGSFMPALALTPDGRRLIYTGVNHGVRQIYVRDLSSRATLPLPDTEDAEGLFVSPDGKWVGYFSGNALRKVALGGGGAPETIATMNDFRGAAWSGDGRIVVADSQIGPLKLVSATGGSLDPLTQLQGTDWSHRHPHFLPDGDTFIYCVQNVPDFTFDRGELWAYQLTTRRRTRIPLNSCDTRYMAPGYLLFSQGGHLNAAPFDPATLKVTGDVRRMADGIATQINTGAVQMAVSRNGTLVYGPGGPVGGDVELALYARDGSSRTLADLKGTFRGPRLSPGGDLILMQGIGANLTGVWAYEMSSHALRRQFSSGTASFIWSADGSQLLFGTGLMNRQGSRLFMQAADLSGMPRLIHDFGAARGWTLTDISKDGKQVALTVAGDLVTLALEDGAAITPFLATPADEGGLRFSPDGRYATYTSDESGRFEVYAAEFPGPGGRWQLSTAGGAEPVWSRDGREIFFRRQRHLMVVSVSTQGTFRPGAPQELFLGPYEGLLGRQGDPNYEVSADGRQFFLLQNLELQKTQPRLGLIQNWRPAPR